MSNYSMMQIVQKCTALSRYLQIPELATFASNLKRVREDRGITQEKLAEAADLNVRTLQRIESAKMNPLTTTLMRLQAALGCSWEDLFRTE
ncbi:MAG: helix-turn-helix transcriptional regulator [Opitutales bacterium]|jgi:transcriptional regulator with XRE-family HTH domain